MSTRLDSNAQILFQVITTYDCRTREDILLASHGAFTALAQVDEVLTYVRFPEHAEEFGWTIPHVRRGRPREEQDYRYQVVGITGQLLRPDGIMLIQEGALSTTRSLASFSRNQAHALRVSSQHAIDKPFLNFAKRHATVLDGVAAQAEGEAERLVSLVTV